MDLICDRMKFIVYSQISEKKLSTSLGLPEYSYYFVLRSFLPVLQELGQVVVVSQPEEEVDAIYDECRKQGEDCLFLTFSPPHKSAVNLRCPTVCVLAWEYDPVPKEEWDNDPKNNWHYVLSNHCGMISLSQYAADAVKTLMGDPFSIAVIPAPVWNAFDHFRNQYVCAPDVKQSDILIKGNVVDSRNYEISPDSFVLLDPYNHFQIQEWSGETLNLRFSKTDEFSAYMGGFYKPENWGAWSRIRNPWVLLPYRLSGDVQLKIVACGYGANFDRDIFVELGDEKKKFHLKTIIDDIQVDFRLNRPDSMLKFSGLDLSPVPDATDLRSMGIGLQSIEISGSPRGKQADKTGPPVSKVSLDGIVYTSVFSPLDGRKNWDDMVTAFCTAFQDVEDATLVLKMSHHSLSSFLGKLHFMLHQLSPFKCRIVALHGYMDSMEYEKLVAATHYYVNASKCEGLCLPLMEFMACRKPSLSPRHTAMADYIHPSSTFMIDSNIEPCMWPHDSRNLFRAVRHRVDWESLVNAYRKSYDVLKNQPETYRQMAEEASLQMENFASNSVVKEKLQKFLNNKLECHV